MRCDYCFRETDFTHEHNGKHYCPHCITICRKCGKVIVRPFYRENGSYYCFKHSLKYRVRDWIIGIIVILLLMLPDYIASLLFV